MSEQLLLERPEPHVLILRLNRPEKFNALSRQLVDELRAAVAGVNDSDTKVMILAANGRGFCAGADLKERKIMSDEEKYIHNRAISALADEIAASPVPTIAAINGLALGGGCELSLACDIRFAAEGASIGLTEARIGAMPGAGGSQRLPRIIGLARALEMMYSGEPTTAEKALEWGLANAVVAPERLDDHALDFAVLLASRAQKTAALLKRAVYGGLDSKLAEGLELERLAITEILASDDYKEGLAAFAEKRSPNFR